ncbi:hypothetical protein GCM10027416_12270 [Okibacterium endophyticum]
MKRSTVRKRLVFSAAIACGMLGLASCSASGAAEGGELDLDPLNLTAEQESEFESLYEAAIESGETEVAIYAGHHDEYLGIYEAFENRFPGLTIQPETYVGAELQTALEAEKQSGRHVVGVISNPNADRYAEQGFAEAYRPVTFEIPAWTEGRISPDQIEDPKGFYHAPWALLFASSYNTELLDENELPGTWAELADDEWEGKLTFMTPATPGGTQTVLATLLNDGVVDEEWLRTVASHAKIVAQDQLALQSISSGEFPFQPLSATTSVLNAQEDGAPVAVHFMDEDNVASTEKWMLAADSPSPEASKLLLSFLFTNEAQNATVEAGNFPLAQDSSVESPHGWPALEDVNFVPIPEQTALRAKALEYSEGLFREISGN